MTNNQQRKRNNARKNGVPARRLKHIDRRATAPRDIVLLIASDEAVKTMTFDRVNTTPEEARKGHKGQWVGRFGWSTPQTTAGLRYLRTLTHGEDLDYSVLTEDQIVALQSVFLIVCATEEDLLARIVLPGMKTDWYSEAYGDFFDCYASEKAFVAGDSWRRQSRLPRLQELVANASATEESTSEPSVVDLPPVELDTPATPVTVEDIAAVIRSNNLETPVVAIV